MATMSRTHFQRPRCAGQFGNLGRATRCPARRLRPARRLLARPGGFDHGVCRQRARGGSSRSVGGDAGAGQGTGFSGLFYDRRSQSGCSAPGSSPVRPPRDPLFFLRLARVYHAAAWPDRIVTPACPSLGLPNWTELFLWEATNSSPNIYSTVEQRIPFRAEVMEQVLLAAGEPGPLLMRAVMMADSHTDSPTALRRILCLQGFAAMAGRYPEVIEEGLGQSAADRRTHVLELLLKREIDPSPFAARIVELAVCNQKTVRQAAEPLLSKVPTVALPFIRAKAENGTSDERALAAQVDVADRRRNGPGLPGRSRQEMILPRRSRRSSARSDRVKPGRSDARRRGRSCPLSRRSNEIPI